jgi:hypothetical protein
MIVWTACLDKGSYHSFLRSEWIENPLEESAPSWTPPCDMYLPFIAHDVDVEISDPCPDTNINVKGETGTSPHTKGVSSHQGRSDVATPQHVQHIVSGGSEVGWPGVRGLFLEIIKVVDFVGSVGDHHVRKRD